MPREHTAHSKHALPKTRDDSTHGHHEMGSTEIRLIISYAAEDRERKIQSVKSRPGADCCSDHELLIANFRLS